LGIYKIVEKRGQLFRRTGVLLIVVSRARNPTGPVSPIRNTDSPPICKAPTVSGAFTPFRTVLLELCKADLAVKRQRSSAVEGKHDSQGDKSQDVVVDSETLMDADVEEGNEQVDGDE
jgi:hypothetical protein